MRILHLSDFHLDKETREDSKRHVVTPIINTIKQLQKEKEIDLILFTGDLINIGGKNYDSIENAFIDFKDVFIQPLLDETSLANEKFFFVPGNHDVLRSADSVHLESGLTANLKTEEAINAFFLKPEGINRILPFKEFENLFYSDVSIDKKHSAFESSYKLRIKDYTVGIACLNSSWRCYDSDTDQGKILIGEKQLNNVIDHLDGCDIKIALSHHSYDWLYKEDSEVVTTLLKQHFNLFFCGHVHKLSTGFYQDPDGQLFTLCAPGILSTAIRKPEKKHENGFTVVDYSIENALVKLTFYKGEYLKPNYILNTSIGKNGVWEAKIPKNEEVVRIENERILIKEIQNENIPKFNSHLLTHATDTNAPKSINEIFVMPTISIKNELDANKKDKIVENLTELILSKKNHIVFGTKESGKTVLLDKLFMDIADNNKLYHTLPVLFDFKEFNGNIIQTVKKFWNQNTQTTKDYLKNYKVLLLIDNISFEENDREKIKALNEFLQKNPNISFIATYLQIFEDDYPLNIEISSMLQYDMLNLKQFKSKQIKLLIAKWFKNTDRYDTPKKLETLINAFVALNLPRTPFTVSMFLWIIEKQENYKPINNSTLIENFIEKLLKKHNSQEALRERFGYDNKIWILSDIAKKMLDRDNENYSLSYATFISDVDEYLRTKKFTDFGTEKVTRSLLDSGLFIIDNDTIRFRFACFFEFFLVKRMEKNEDFKTFVLDETNFLEYINEIDYYTGLNRGDSKLLKLIITRLEEGYADLSKLISEKQEEKGYSNIDDFFTVYDEKGKEKPSLVSQLDEKHIVEFLPSNKPTEEDIEIEDDNKLELNHNENGIAKKQKGNKLKDLGKLLVLSLRVLKNSEEVHEENLKFKAYESSLRNSIYFALLQKAVFELFLLNKENLPKEKVEEFVMMDRFLPLLHQLLVFDNAGTQKLAEVIREKIELDDKNNVSEFEKFLSVFLYADIRAKSYDQVISNFLKKAKKSFILDMSYFKLVTYYYYRSKDDAMDLFYLNLIADLLIEIKGYKKEKKVEIIADYKRKKMQRSITSK